MPLPQQVINQLNQEKPDTPGFSWGILLFSGGLLVLVLILYVFMAFIYTPYLNNKINTLQSNIDTVDQSINSNNEAQLVAFYSQTMNLQSILRNHVLFSRFLTWLQNNTQANVWYTQFAFSQGNQITMTGSAKTEADINQQIAVFEATPLVKNLVISNVGLPASNGTWSFAATLLMDPSIFVASTTTQ